MKPAPLPQTTLFPYLFGGPELSGRKIVDLFAGGGGVSAGIEAALGRSPDVAINHDEEALAMHQVNHPLTRHYRTDVFEVDPHEAVGDAPVALLWLSPDCFPAGTLVLTRQGYRAIEQLAVGDEVLTHRNRWRSVTEVSSAARPLVEISGQGHPGIRVSPEHPFYARQRKDYWDNSQRKQVRHLDSADWTPASLLGRGWYWASPVHFPESEIPAVPEYRGRCTTVTLDLLWLAGRYVADGWTRLTDSRAELVLTCGAAKVDALEARLATWTRQGVRSSSNEMAWHKRETSTAFQFSASHRGLVEWLREHFGHGAEQKHFPAWVLGMSEEYRQSLLDGYLSGDGCRPKADGTALVECSTISKALAFSAKALAASLGKTVSVHYRQQQNTVIEGRTVNAKPYWSVRWREQTDVAHVQVFRDSEHEWAAIRKQTPASASETVYNIGVDEDESYVVEGIVVHNCKHHSPAKGGKPLDHKTRSLGWVAHKWAGKKQPDVIVLENVPAFQQWGRLVAQRGEVGEDGKKVKLPWPNKPKRRGKACRRWKKGMAKQCPPRGPVMYDEAGQQLKVADKRPRHQGKTFRAFVTGLERLGYVVEYRTLVAADYGVPTIRERFFLVARRDGRPIVWPEQTHAPANDPRVLHGELLPWVPASTCIDWTLPIPSVFPEPGGRQKALKSKSLTRIALGVKKFVLQNPRPFLVQLAHGGHAYRQQDAEHPAWTITGSDRMSLAQPCIIPMNAENPPCPADEPLRTVTTGNRFYLAPTFLTAYYGDKGQADGRGQIPDLPLRTIPTANRHGVVACHITQYNSGGLAPEHANYSLDKPVRTITAQGGRQFLTAAALVQYNGTARGQSAENPIPTLSTVERFGVMTAHMLRNFGTSDARSVDEPLASQTAVVKDGVVMAHAGPVLDKHKRAQAARVYALMRDHCPEALEQLAPEDHAQQLVTLHLNGEKQVLWDIGMRMLTPRELYRCQGFENSYIIDFSIKGKPLAKDSQTRMCGNSVPPRLVAALIDAQFSQELSEAAD